MTVFRWILGVLGALLAVGSIVSFVLFIAFDIAVWLERARALRRSFFSVALLWFNVEVWGRVVWTLWHWNS